MARQESRCCLSYNLVSDPDPMPCTAREADSPIEAKKLYHIIRTPTWVPPPRLLAWKMMGKTDDMLRGIELDGKGNFSQLTIERFKADPEFYRRFVKGVEAEVNSTLSLVSRPPLDAIPWGC